MQWNNLWHSPMQGDTMSVGTSMIMMGVDSCIYFFVAWYISHVFPRKATWISFVYSLNFDFPTFSRKQRSPIPVVVFPVLFVLEIRLFAIFWFRRGRAD